mgnify:CR=1 FL=1
MIDFTDDEIKKLIEELNPGVFDHSKKFDLNWEELKREAQTYPIRYDLDRSVKTKTPTVLAYETGYFGFVYRRYDGAHWHSEYCTVDTEHYKCAMTENQNLLRDNINTCLNFLKLPRVQWITPENNGKFDPRYQLMRCEDRWFCMIKDKIYEESSRRKQENKTYEEIYFSTNNKAVFTVEETNKLLDQLI